MVHKRVQQINGKTLHFSGNADSAKKKTAGTNLP